MKVVSLLVEHAQRELEIIRCPEDEYGDALGQDVLALIELFAAQGHSGMSAGMTIELFAQLARFENLTPIDSNPNTWVDVSESSGKPMWQSKRNPAIFSEDHGKTNYNVNDPAKKTKPNYGNWG